MGTYLDENKLRAFNFEIHIPMDGRGIARANLLDQTPLKVSLIPVQPGVICPTHSIKRPRHYTISLSLKKSDSSITLMSTVKLGQAPISSHKLKASLYLRIIFINFFYSLFVIAESFRSIFSNKISALDWNCLGSSFANQG